MRSPARRRRKKQAAFCFVGMRLLVVARRDFPLLQYSISVYRRRVCVWKTPELLRKHLMWLEAPFTNHHTTTPPPSSPQKINKSEPACCSFSTWCEAEGRYYYYYSVAVIFTRRESSLHSEQKQAPHCFCCCCFFRSEDVPHCRVFLFSSPL